MSTMTMNSDRQPSREVLAYHEAGHAVVTWALGIQLAKVVVNRDAQYSEVAELAYKRLHVQEGEASTRWKQSLVFVAGGCSQRRQFPEIDFGWEGDHEYAVANARRIFDLTGQNVWPEVLVVECEKILATHWHRVERLARVLLEKDEILGINAESIISIECLTPE